MLVEYEKKSHTAAISYCHGDHLNSVTKNAYKQPFWMLILRELLQVTSIPHSNDIKTMVLREIQHWASRLRK